MTESLRNYIPTKTNRSLKIFKLPTLAPLVTAITFALVIRSALAQERVDLVVHENSPTSLSVTGTMGSTTIMGINVSNTSPDNWTVTLPFAVQSNFDHYNWTKSPTTSNVVTFTGDGSTFTVVSDSTEPPTEDGPFPDNSTFPVGALAPDGVIGVDMGFGDLADSKEGHGVPDTGSTFGLLLASVIALAVASRFRHIQFA